MTSRLIRNPGHSILRTDCDSELREAANQEALTPARARHRSELPKEWGQWNDGKSAITHSYFFTEPTHRRIRQTAELNYDLPSNWTPQGSQ